MKTEPLFAMPFWQVSCKRWKQRKKKLIEMLDPYLERKVTPANFHSNRYVKDKSELISGFYDLFKTELSSFSKLIKSNYQISDLWSSSYDKGDYQNPHTHGATGYSAVLYVDLPSLSSPTRFVQPWNDPVIDQTLLRNVYVKEGDIIIFPKIVLHFSPPNQDKKRKRIVSWDMEPTPWLQN